MSLINSIDKGRISGIVYRMNALKSMITEAIQFRGIDAQHVDTITQDVLANVEDGDSYSDIDGCITEAIEKHTARVA